MKITKALLTLFLLSGMSLAACDFLEKPKEETPAGETEGGGESEGGGGDGGGSTGGNDNIIHGHGAPTNDKGSLYSLYVDDDNGKIYEKSKAYVKTNKSRAAGDDDAKWIYTNCEAGSHFDKNSAQADAVRTTLLSTNVTMKYSLGVQTHEGSSEGTMDVVTYIKYNFGSVLQKQALTPTATFDESMLVGYSLYDIDNDSYQLFLQSGPEITDCTSWIDSDNPMEKQVAIGFTTRCLSNNMENACHFSLVDTFLEEIDNFVLTDGTYKLDKQFNITNVPFYDAIYGENNYYILFKDLQFTLSEDGKSLDNFRFYFEYGNTEKTSYMCEDFFAEVSELRTTSLDVE